MTIRFGKTCLLALAIVGSAASAARSADVFVGEPVETRVASTFRVLDEVRLGVMAHSPGYKEGGTVAINGEVLTSRLQTNFENPILRFLFTPRFHVGGTVNTGGETSWGYGGLTWTIDFASWAFVEVTFGGGVHNGELKPPTGPDKLWLGSRVLFRESASLGFRVTEQVSVLATVEHLSNAGLATYNNGITTVGGRVGYQF